MNQKNMKECGKRKSYISSKRQMIYTSSNNGRHPVTKYICLKVCMFNLLVVSTRQIASTRITR